MLYAYQRNDVARELARRHGTLDRSVDGNRDAWDADACNRPSAAEVLPSRSLAGPGTTRYTMTPLRPPAGDAGPPPARSQHPLGKLGQSRFQSARARWYERTTGLPLCGTPAEVDRQFHDATRAHREPDPVRVHINMTRASPDPRAHDFYDEPALA